VALDVIKYFGFELGAQTNIDPKDDRWIINGAHDASKLQDHLDGFISKFVLCKGCKNPETIVNIQDGRIKLDCKACGHISEPDLRLKLSSYILKTAPKKGKKDKSTKKADRKARRAAGKNGDDNGSVNGNGSPADSNSDHADGDGDEDDNNGVSDNDNDAMFKKINSEAKQLDELPVEKEVEWTVDTSEAAVKARMQSLPDDLKRTALNDDEDGDEAEGGNTVYDQLGKWVQTSAEELGGVAKVDEVEIYLKAKEFHIETKHRTLTVLAQTIFDDNILKQIDARAPMLKRMISSERHEKAFLGGTERFVGLEKPNLVNQISSILMKYFQNDLVSEEVLKAWGSKASKKYVDIATSKKVRKSAEKFMEWLENAESDDESDDE